MKRTLLTLLVSLTMAAFCLPTGALAGGKGNVSSNDILIKSEVETAVSMLQAIYNKQQAGDMTLAQAKKLGADLLRELRYGNDGYFWAHTTEGISVVMLGRTDIEGKNRLDARDLKGNSFVKEMLAKGNAGGGYLEYWYTKKGQSQPLSKRSYVLPFKPFGWVVGSGYYR